jgi:tellurite resistance-related uncharacterized protein
MVKSIRFERVPNAFAPTGPTQPRGHNTIEVEFGQEYVWHGIREVMDLIDKPQMTPTMRMSKEDAREVILHNIHMHTDDIERFLDFLVRADYITDDTGKK